MAKTKVILLVSHLTQICLLILISNPPSAFSIQQNVLKTDIGNNADPDFRLPRSILPINYKLELMTILDREPGFQPFTARGKVWITAECMEQTAVITLHAANLTINNDTIRVTNKASGTNEAIVGLSYNNENDFMFIELVSLTKVAEKYEIYVEFVAPISSDRLNGMYLDFYNDTNSGETRYIATTLFAPYHTRRAFPCFDEPSFRATYDITLGHHIKYHAMSNTEIIDTRPIENMPEWQWDTFKATPSISSYITAMIVSDLEFEEAPPGSFRNVTIRVYGKPESIKRGAGTYGATLTGKVMTYFEFLFIVTYPISKLYSVALPQFFFSAMENWGLITYKEPVLLYIPGETTEDERYNINYVLSHENAHQHFGNLVACKWWAYVWLKEGFSTYYAHYAINHTNPEFLPWEQFIPNILQKAMNFDSSNETHPLENYPPTSADVAGIYTTIPYQKGASILRMASSIVTESVFLSGIQLYVHRFQYQSAEQNDVFQALQESVDASSTISSSLPTSVKNILNTWTTQSGYPVLKVKVLDGNTVEISQEKFIDGDPNNPLDMWWVPIYLSPRPNDTLPENFPDAWIPQSVQAVRVNMPTDELIIVNPAVIGYYRVIYERELIQKIKNQLVVNHLEIKASARGQILNDYFNFAIVGYSDIETVLNLTTYLDGETDLAVWQSVLPLIEKFSKLLVNTKIDLDFRAYFGTKVWNALKRLENLNQSKDDKGATAILKSYLMKWACSLGNSECLDRSKVMLSQLMNNPGEDSIPVDVQEAVYCSGAVEDSPGTEGSTWAFLYSQYLNRQLSGSFSPSKTRLLKALTCSRNRSSIRSLLGMLLSGSSEVEESDKAGVLTCMVNNPVGKELVLELLEDSAELISVFKSEKELSDFIKSLTSHLLSAKDIETLEVVAQQLAPCTESLLLNILRQAEKTQESFSLLLQPLGNWLRNRMH